jgi:hypothetical protein
MARPSTPLAPLQTLVRARKSRALVAQPTAPAAEARVGAELAPCTRGAKKRGEL